MKRCLAIARSFALSTALLGAGGAIAQQPQPAKVTPLLKEAMAEWPGKEVRSFLVEFPPGGESVSHSHPGPILAYVLKGAWTVQLEGAPLTTLRDGQVAYEHAGKMHVVSRNASTTEPLQLVVFLISDPGAAVSIPLPK